MKRNIFPLVGYIGIGLGVVFFLSAGLTYLHQMTLYWAFDPERTYSDIVPLIIAGIACFVIGLGFHWRAGLGARALVLVAIFLVSFAVAGFGLWQLVEHYHLTWDSGWVVPHEASVSNYTAFFNVNSYQWNLIWAKWEGPVNASTRLIASVYYSDETHSTSIIDYATQLSTISNIAGFAETVKGTFKLVLNSNYPNSGPDAYWVVVEVWEPN